jgi:hypothetical protein
MPVHVFAFYENVAANTTKEITIVRDDVLTRTGDTRFMVPVGLHNLLWGFVAGVKLGDAYVKTASLETRRYVCRPFPKRIGDTVVTPDAPEIWLPDPPIKLTDTEEIALVAQNTDTSSAQATVGVFALALDTLPAVPAGEPFILRCTGSTTLTAYQWTSVKLTPEVTLPVGTYAVVDFLPISAGCIAARLLVPGQVWRPGVLGVAGSEPTALDHCALFGKLLPKYEMGRFPHNAIPEVQFLSKSADTSEVVYLKLVKVA